MDVCIPGILGSREKEGSRENVWFIRVCGMSHLYTRDIDPNTNPDTCMCVYTEYRGLESMRENV